MEEERLTDIETKLAFQEKMLKDLNDVVVEQQNQIEALGSTCEKLIKLVKQAALQGRATDAPADEKPPHY